VVPRCCCVVDEEAFRVREKKPLDYMGFLGGEVAGGRQCGHCERWQRAVVPASQWKESMTTLAKSTSMLVMAHAAADIDCCCVVRLPKMEFFGAVAAA
jgi:hypothetical protein